MLSPPFLTARALLVKLSQLDGAESCSLAESPAWAAMQKRLKARRACALMASGLSVESPASWLDAAFVPGASLIT